MDEQNQEGQQTESQPQAQSQSQSQSQPQPQPQPQPEPQAQPEVQPQPQPASPEASKADSSDVEKNKSMAIVGYIIPILFFIPLLSEETKNSPFAKFHAGQQLNFLIFLIAGWIIFSVVSAILAMTIILIPLITLVWILYCIGCLIFMIKGIIHVNKGEMKKLPMIGGYTILK